MTDRVRPAEKHITPLSVYIGSQLRARARPPFSTFGEECEDAFRPCTLLQRDEFFFFPFSLLFNSPRRERRESNVWRGKDDDQGKERYERFDVIFIDDAETFQRRKRLSRTEITKK